MKRFLFSLTLVLACFFAAPTEVAAQTTVIGYRTVVDYYGNYYRVPVYGYVNSYRPRTYNPNAYSNGTTSGRQKSVSNPAALHALEQNRRKQAEIKAQIDKAERERVARWAKSFNPGG